MPKNRYNEKFTGEVRRWNKTLADCYLRNCTCKDCPIYKTYQFECKCKIYVIEAVRKFGVPEKLLKKRHSDIIED